MNINEITLVKTCGACPEQYDAFDKSGKQIAYLRLRHGSFTVECPDVGGELVYSVCPNGDGMFDDNERSGYLSDAKMAIASFYNRSATMERIVIRPNCETPVFEMTISVPDDRDAEEYIDEFLDGVLAKELRDSCFWDFADG